ncbi:MAG: sugar transferase [Patescibacteria group bacterium]
MNDLKNKLKKALLLSGDIFILYFSLWLALYVRKGFSFDIQTWQEHLLPFTLIFIAWLLIFFINGYYELKSAKNNMAFYSSLLTTSLFNIIIAIIILYITASRLTNLRPQTVLILDIVIFTCLFIIWRNSFNHLVKAKAWSNNIAIIGLNSKTLEIIKIIRQRPQLGYRLSIVIRSQEDELVSLPDGIEVIDNPADLTKDINNRKIDTIVATIDTSRYPELIDKIFTCLALGINFFDYANFYEKYTGKIPVTVIKQSWFLENLAENDKRLYERLKRIIDISAALVIGLLSLIFIPFIILAIKINSHGSIIFKQYRVGKNGKIFLALKFRSMKIDAEKAGPQWAQKDDPRTTRVGKFLRKTRIDEIPQLLNVLKGEMSLIGPRPERTEFVNLLEKEIPFYRERLLVKPGLTGWAQINFPYGASKEDALEKLQYDLYYIKNRSLFLDLSILLKTSRIVLSRQGR